MKWMRKEMCWMKNEMHVDSLRNENQQVQRSQFDAEKKVAVADTSVQNLQRVIAQIEEERKLRDAAAASSGPGKDTEGKRTGDKESGPGTIAAAPGKYQRTDIADTIHCWMRLRNKLAEENRKLDAKKNEHDLLKSMIDSMEGYPDTVKFLHNNHNWNHTSPILSDMLYVKEEYRTALENVLEPYLELLCGE